MPDILVASFPGSIPACAGEPTIQLLVVRWTRVYPRVCGGTLRGLGGKHCHQGLSPRVRGNLRAALQNHIAAGSIPACAGEPGEPVVYMEVFGVYPRVCGGTAAV